MKKVKKRRVRRVSVERLWKEHEEFLTAHGGEFLNSGWGQGPKFVHSKTDIGRLYSEVVKGKVLHWWTPGGGRGYSQGIDHPVRARLPRKEKIR